MPDQPDQSFSWVCTECGRRVPRKVSSCRCGFVKVNDGGADESHDAHDQQEPTNNATASSSVSVSTAVIAVLAVSLVGVFWLGRRSSISPGETKSGRSDAATPTASGPTASGPTVAGPTASGPTDEPTSRSDRTTRTEPPIAVPAPSEMPPPSPQPNAVTTASALSRSGGTSSIEDLVARVMPAVITVQTGNARGSGFFVGPDTILTNVHVVGNHAGVTIRHSDGTVTNARVESTSTAYDIAVLKTSTPLPNQPTIPLGTINTARIGQEIIVIGTPLGFLQNTVSRGIISGLREVDGSTLLQTDAAINPGNSGGPVLDRNGTALGIVKSGYSGRDGLSFAVAIDHAQAVLEGRSAPPVAVSATPSPYKALSPAVMSPTDQLRQDGSHAFEQAIDRLARQADALDQRWRSFRRGCYRGPIGGSFDREWFALYDERAMQGVVARGCDTSFSEIRRQADEIHAGILEADEAARRANVYPGERRAALGRQRLDFSGWSR
jgi:S1-C subfamily serine protease